MSARAKNIAFIVLGLFVSSCSGGPTGSEEEILQDGILATFSVEGETFAVWITSPQTIEQVLNLRDGESQATIPNGPLRKGPGRAAHNEPWSWHMDPEETVMAETTIELCDGLPSFVESDIDQWIDVVGRFCPWGAVLVSVRDFR